MTRRDKWLKPPRPRVARYWEFKRQLLTCDHRANWDELSIEFRIPMPRSWSQKKKAEMALKPHTVKPDLDNLIKAFKDALLTDDSSVWRYGRMTKVWDYEGSIVLISDKAH
jgi:Holliday junction resolvase RusA-like endonuclease